MKLRVTTYGHPGSKHSRSEDRFAVNPLDNGGLIGVFSDGVGSSRDPERCAERTVRLVADGFSARPRQWTVPKVFDRLVEQANRSLYEEGFYCDGTASMQATLSAVCIHQNCLQGCNAGDSPVLLVRGEQTERLSESHALLDPEGHEVLTRAIGMGPELVLHHFKREMVPGDRVVLVSDGVSKLLNDQALGLAVRKCRSAQQLIETTLEGATEQEIDDLSAILIEVEQSSLIVLESPAPEIWPAPRKGRIHDGYLLLQCLAGNARVWLAEKKGIRSVLKFVPEEAETDDSGIILARFAAERWTACRLQSPFFVPSHIPESGSSHYYIMDYMEAPSLRFVLKSRRLAVDEVVELGIFLCRSGRYLLGHELVHGDIKPDNLMIFRENGIINFKLLDLGLASPVFTANGASGTPSYLAPERFRGAAVTERTEIFSMGATLYEALTGRPPFGQIERFQRPEFGRVIRPSRLNPHIPPWLDGVILKCLSIRQEQRFQCYTELLFALEHPDQVLPFFETEGPWLERNPLLFYKMVCILLLLTVIILTCKIATLAR